MKGGRAGARSSAAAGLQPAGRWELRRGFTLPLSLAWGGFGARGGARGGQRAGMFRLGRPLSDRPALANPRTQPGEPSLDDRPPPSPPSLTLGCPLPRASSSGWYGHALILMAPGRWGSDRRSDGHFVRERPREGQGLGSHPRGPKTMYSNGFWWFLQGRLAPDGEGSPCLAISLAGESTIQLTQNYFLWKWKLFFRVVPQHSVRWGKEWVSCPALLAVSWRVWEINLAKWLRMSTLGLKRISVPILASACYL